MDDRVMWEIEQLVAEEHKLLEAGGVRGAAGLPEAQHRRLKEIGIRLDQLWDELRQRRARRAAGLDPDDASPRSADMVEHYAG